MPRSGEESGVKGGVGECSIHGNCARCRSGLPAPIHVQRGGGNQASFQRGQRDKNRASRAPQTAGDGGRARGPTHLPLHGTKTRLPDLHGQRKRTRRPSPELVSRQDHAQQPGTRRIRSQGWVQSHFTAVVGCLLQNQGNLSAIQCKRAPVFFSGWWQKLCLQEDLNELLSATFFETCVRSYPKTLHSVTLWMLNGVVPMTCVESCTFYRRKLKLRKHCKMFAHHCSHFATTHSPWENKWLWFDPEKTFPEIVHGDAEITRMKCFVISNCLPMKHRPG